MDESIINSILIASSLKIKEHALLKIIFLGYICSRFVSRIAQTREIVHLVVMMNQNSSQVREKTVSEIDNTNKIE